MSKIKKSSTKHSSKNILNSFLLSLKEHPFGYMIILIGAFFITWPRFFIADIRNYPKCIAYDFFPYSYGYPSDFLNSFTYFIQLPLMLVGALLASYAVGIIRQKFDAKSILVVFTGVVVVAILLHILALLAAFDISTDRCSGYSNVFPDFNLIINSRN